MATRAVAQTVCFVAWDTTNNAGKTGDGANFTMRWVKDGTSAALTVTTVTEIDSTNAPGLYKVGISSTESDCNIGYLAGKSSTSAISIMPVKVEFERLPDAAPTAAGGVNDCTRFGGTTVTGRDIGASVLLSTGTGTGQLDFTSGVVKSNMTQIAGSAVATGTAQLGVNVVNWNASAVTKNSSNVPEVAVRYWRDSSVQTSMSLETIATVGSVSTSIGTGAIASTSFASGAITAAAIAADAIGASELASDAITEIQSGLATSSALTSAASDITAIKTKTDFLPSATAGSAGGVFIAGTNAATTVTTSFTTTFTGNLTGNVGGSVASVATGGITAASIATDAIGSNELAASAIDEIVDAVWDELKSGHAVSGSYGEAASDWASQTDLADVATDVDVVRTNVALILDDTGTSGVILSTAMLNKIADHVRRRTQANVQASSDGDAISKGSLYGFIQQAQKSDTTTTPGVLTILNPDGSPLGTATIASDDAAEPITGIS